MSMPRKPGFVSSVRQLWQEVSSTALILLGLTAATELVIWHAGGISNGSPDALLSSSGLTSFSAQTFALALDVLLPVSLLLPEFLLQQDLLQHRRALFAAYPDSALQRLGRLLALLAALGVAGALGTTILPALFRAPVRPFAAVLVTLPTVVALTGASFLASEWSRHPATGFLAGLLWAAGSLTYQHLATPIVPVPLAVLFAGSSYSSSAALWSNRLITLGAGAALWAVGGLAQHSNRRRGLDV